MTTPLQITKPGIYRGMASELYFGDPCPVPSLTQSIAKTLIDQSAAHARTEHPRLLSVAEKEDEEAEKYIKAQAIGNAAHRELIGRMRVARFLEACRLDGRRHSAGPKVKRHGRSDLQSSCATATTISAGRYCRGFGPLVSCHWPPESRHGERSDLQNRMRAHLGARRMAHRRQ